MSTLNRKIIDKYLFFRISDVNLSVSIKDFDSVINVENPTKKSLIYKHKRYKIIDLADILELKVPDNSKYGITKDKDVYLIYSVLSVGTPEKIIPFDDKITEKKIYKNYIFYEGNIFLQIDIDTI